ncbi:UDP-N-acetylenolpyruvoylglucosamine reductase [Synergistales bacterium]|nr:UDP-N-acetylenolpyruvoylglucosamine reductase [Synergistales bacterium]
MSADWRTDFKKDYARILQERASLAALSALGVGGEAEFFVEPDSLNEVCEIFRFGSVAGFPVYVLGGGTNVVFSDGTLNGVTLSARRLCGMSWDGELLVAEAGVPMPLIVSEAAKRRLAGVEFAYGIPGSLGGAVAGNAGAGGRGMSDVLEEVTTVERDGSVREWHNGEFSGSYRSFSLSATGRLIAKCKIKFQNSSREDIERETEIFKKAREGQPREGRSAGCTFKNPPGDSAGRLLDVAGCKGLRVGGAVVSGVHANFIINSGGASGMDIVELIGLCRDMVFQKTGISLENEIKLLGF